MNQFEENRAFLVSKLTQDKVEFFPSPFVKSKTPIPKRMSKETIKQNKKKLMKKSNTSKTEKYPLKNNTHGMKESNSNFKRTKNKGSVSVELFNGSKEIQRPQSVISKSFFNHLELAKKVKSLEKNSNGLNIEKIIKKSLLKAKSTKLSKEKDQKQGLLQDEIRRQELKYQNNQIRKQNGQKILKKKGKKLSRRAEKNSRIFDRLPNSIKSNSVSQYPRDYLSKVQDLYLKDYGKMRDHNSDENIVNIPKESDYFEEISDIQLNELSDERENFSFIKTEELKGKKLHKENSLAEGQLSKSLDLSLQRQEYLREENEKNYFDHVRYAQKKTLSLSFQNSLKIVKTKPKLSTFLSSTTTILPKLKGPFKLAAQSQISIKPTIAILPEPYLAFQVDAQSQISISPASTTISESFQPVFSYKQNNTFTPSNTLSLPSTTPNNTQSLVNQVSEELSSTLSSLFLIEQLKLSELSTLSDLSKMIPADVNKNLTFQIEKKYSSIIKYLQPDIELRTAKYVSCLSQAQGSEFLQKTQKKKQNLHSLLSELKISNSLVKEFADSEISGSSSSSDDRMQALGISHSRSVIRLHEDLYSATEVKGSEIDFGFKENSPEPAVPILNLSLKPIECEVLESRRVCTMDSILKFSKKVFKLMNKDEILNTLKKPLIKNPLSQLDKIQDLQIGTFTDNEISQFEPVFDYSPCYSIELFEQSSEYKDQETQKSEKIYKGLILESINYLLQQFRPYGYDGYPLPWSVDKSELNVRKISFDLVIEKTFKNLRELNMFCIGKHEDVEGSAFEDESAMLKYKERQLDKLIHFEAQTEEFRWLDYEFEETQVKIDLSDVILYELVTEVININNV